MHDTRCQHGFRYDSPERGPKPGGIMYRFGKHPPQGLRTGQTRRAHHDLQRPPVNDHVGREYSGLVPDAYGDVIASLEEKPQITTQQDAAGTAPGADAERDRTCDVPEPGAQPRSGWLGTERLNQTDERCEEILRK